MVLASRLHSDASALDPSKATSPRSIVFANLKAQRDVDVAQSLHLDFAFLFTVPVGDPVRLDLDEHDVRRVDALVEPTI